MTSQPRLVHYPPVRSFGRLDPDKWLAQKTLEEAAEFTVAAKEWIKARDRGDALAEALKADMIGEYADTVQTLANWAAAIGLSDETIAQAMSDCLERNRRKGRL